MNSALLIDNEPRPDFSDLVPPGEPTYAIQWRGDAGLSGCGCGCGECQGPMGGCGCSSKSPFDHMDVVADGWDGPGGCGGSCSGAKDGCGKGCQATNTSMMRPAMEAMWDGERVLADGGDALGWPLGHHPQPRSGDRGPGFDGPLVGPDLWATPWGGGFVPDFPGRDIPWTPSRFSLHLSTCNPIYPIEAPAPSLWGPRVQTCFDDAFGATSPVGLNYPTAATCCRPWRNVQPLAPPDGSAASLGRSYFEILPGFEPAYDSILDLLGATWVFMLENIDIVEWTACLVSEYSRESRHQPFHLTYDFGQRCHLPWLLQSHWNPLWSMKFEGLFDRPDATGAIDLGNMAFRIPENNAWWFNASQAYQERFNRPERALCAVTWAAGNLLHEWVHACSSLLDGEPGPGSHGDGDVENNDTPDFCWDEPRMMNGAFAYAIGQRYAGLADEPCCCPVESPLIWMPSAAGDDKMWCAGQDPAQATGARLCCVNFACS